MMSVSSAHWTTTIVWMSPPVVPIIPIIPLLVFVAKLIIVVGIVFILVVVKDCPTHKDHHDCDESECDS